MPYPNKYDEKEIIRLVSEGDEAAFTMLVNERSPVMYNFLVKLSRNPELAEEVVQDIFTQLWLTRESLNGVNNMHAYLFTIARNHAFQLMKKLDRERMTRNEWAARQDSNSEDAYEKERWVLWVEEATDQLSPQQKRVWELNRRQGKKYKEIAAELGISPETVKSYLQIANASIITYLKKRLGPAALLAFLKLFFN